MFPTLSIFQSFIEMELDDLHKDIELLIAQYKIDHANESVSNYRFFENIVHINNELFGNGGLQEEISTLNLTDFTNLEEFSNNLKKKILVTCHEKGIAPAAYLLIERKIKKILVYIEQSQMVSL